MAGLTLYGIIAPFQLKLGPINCLVFLMLGLYIVNLLLQPKESEKSEEEADSINLTVKQILLRFIICAVLLVSVSIAITYATDIVADELNLSATFAGSLFLAIATSLPEVVSTITLCKKGNFNAGFGNIIGSNVFNFLILVIAEFMSFAGSVFKPGDVEAKMMSIYLIIGSVVGILILLNTFIFRKNEKYQKHPMIFNISSIILGLSTISCYLLYLLVK
jgi:cation:H+ antiporter